MCKNEFTGGENRFVVEVFLYVRFCQDIREDQGEVDTRPGTVFT